MKILGCVVVLGTLAAIGQTFTPANPAALAARQWRQQHERAVVDEFVALLSIPNIATDRENIARNAEAIAAMMRKRGVAAKLVSVPGGNPVVFGEIKTPGATRTIVFYAHYDGQPLDPKEWATGPFTPTLRDKQLEKDGRIIPLPAALACAGPTPWSGHSELTVCPPSGLGNPPQARGPTPHKLHYSGLSGFLNSTGAPCLRRRRLIISTNIENAIAK